jgi:hypothetical protein
VLHLNEVEGSFFSSIGPAETHIQPMYIRMYGYGICMSRLKRNMRSREQLRSNPPKSHRVLALLLETIARANASTELVGVGFIFLLAGICRRRAGRLSRRR